MLDSRGPISSDPQQEVARFTPEPIAAVTYFQKLGVAHLHGTSSGSLMDILQDGLVATGKQERVSFTGEMMGGILPTSLNERAVSVIGIEQVTLAASYADRNLLGWEPSRSEQLVELAESWMREGGASEEVIGEWRHVRAQIEVARHLRWQTLSDEERQLISQPFPVMIGISIEAEAFDTATSVQGEKGITSAPTNQLVIFVPDEHLVTVLGLKTAHQSNCRIEPTSALKLTGPGKFASET